MGDDRRREAALKAFARRVAPMHVRRKVDLFSPLFLFDRSTDGPTAHSILIQSRRMDVINEEESLPLLLESIDAALARVEAGLLLMKRKRQRHHTTATTTSAAPAVVTTERLDKAELASWIEAVVNARMRGKQEADLDPVATSSKQHDEAEATEAAAHCTADAGATTLPPAPQPPAARGLAPIGATTATTATITKPPLLLRSPLAVRPLAAPATAPLPPPAP